MYKKGDDIIYSYEIDQYLKIKKYVLSVSEYCEIVSSSPQINDVKYEDGMFKLTTDDKYEFKVKVKTRINP